jgi:hypothetical protein
VVTCASPFDVWTRKTSETMVAWANRPFTTSNGVHAVLAIIRMIPAY